MSSTTLPVCPKTGSTSRSLTVHLCLHTALLREIGNAPVDTSGAYIPGHGTPTVILFGRHRRPVDGSVRAVMGVRGEPAIPDDAAKGLVWSAIVAQIDQPGSQSEFVSVSDVPRFLSASGNTPGASAAAGRQS